ncbi:MAG: helix-turn-helix domain-containing protein [Terriglobales bacterium]
MKQELEVVLQAARMLPTEELPRLLGDLRVIESVAQARLLAPAPAQPAATNGSDLLDVKQTARYIGMSCGFVYRNADTMPVLRIGNVIRFRRRDLDLWITDRRKAPACR